MNWIIALSVAVLALYLKLIFCVLFYLCMLLDVPYRKCKQSIVNQCAHVPYWLINKILIGGGDRFVLEYISMIPSNHFRKWLYMGLGASISPKVVFHYKTELRSPQKLIVGTGSIIGDNALLDARNGLVIESDVNISSNVSIYTEQHDHRDPYFGCPKNRRMDVFIEKYAWLGSNVIILPGVTIGEGAVCCAGCVVTKDIEPYAVVAGIPAKKVGERTRNLKYHFDGSSCRLY